jgi:2,3-bisphosphoglycerate-independent phosphoglycerate mutase
MRAREIDAPLVTPEQAGANLAHLARDYDLVFYESFLPDLAGHGRLLNDKRRPANDDRPTTTGQRSGASSSLVVGPWSIEAQIHIVMATLDGLIGGVLAEMRGDDTLLLTSDHGNVESLAAPAHTRNPVPLLVVGPGAPAFAPVENIAEVADAIDRVM